MKKAILLAVLLALAIIGVINPVQIYASNFGWETNQGNENIVSLINPGNGLHPAKGDGTDETEIIQAIFNYAVRENKTVLIPEGYIFIVNGIKINNAANFSILGYGTLKHKDNSTKPIIAISYCNNFSIMALNTDGNIKGNCSAEGMVSQFLPSVRIFGCDNFIIQSLNDRNPAGDSLYLNDVNNVTIGTIYAEADVPSGRNALTIIKANNVIIDRVVSLNIGAERMPGGIDFEPNYSTDHITDVVIKSALVRTANGDGVAVTNQTGATVKNISINAEIIKYGNPFPYAFKLNNVCNFEGSIKVYQEKAGLCTGARISGCHNVNVYLEIYDAKNGIDLGVGSSNINLTGKIIRTNEDGISIWQGLKDSVIDMEIKKVALQGKGGIIRLSPGLTENTLFKGDYSYDGTGQFCFRVEGKVINCRMIDLNTRGWSSNNLLTGKKVSFAH